MGPETALIVFCVCIVVASLAGGMVPVVLRLTHRRLQFGLSFVSGVMLGVALFHMVPHALMARMESVPAGGDSHGLFDPLMVALALGFLTMFFLGDSRISISMSCPSQRAMIRCTGARAPSRFA